MEKLHITPCWGTVRILVRRYALLQRYAIKANSRPQMKCVLDFSPYCGAVKVSTNIAVVKCIIKPPNVQNLEEPVCLAHPVLRMPERQLASTSNNLQYHPL